MAMDANNGKILWSTANPSNSTSPGIQAITPPHLLIAHISGTSILSSSSSLDSVLIWIWILLHFLVHFTTSSMKFIHITNCASNRTSPPLEANFCAHCPTQHGQNHPPKFKIYNHSLPIMKYTTKPNIENTNTKKCERKTNGMRDINYIILLAF